MSVALVTGAASGIGLATARAFAPRVSALVMSDLSDRRLSDAVAALRADFPKLEILPVQGNMGEEADITRMHREAVEKFGRIDHAVNNAGTAVVGPLAQYKTADWDKVTGVNERGVFLCLREQLSIMEKQEPLPLPAHITGPEVAAEGGSARSQRAQRGSVVNLSSVLGFAGIPDNAAYVSSKHALVGLVKAAAIEYGAKGIRVNNVAPGFIATPLTTSPSAVQYLRAATSQAKTPMARAGLPEEVADVIVFLSSPEASFVNGATWTVDGGYLSL